MYRIGTPSPTPTSQASSTTYLRIFIASRSPQAVGGVGLALKKISLKHFSGTSKHSSITHLSNRCAGFHSTLDMRTAVPRPFPAYFPALIAQSELNEEITFLNSDGTFTTLNTGHPSTYAPLQPRENYDPSPALNAQEKALFDGPTKSLKLGDVALARSGDKGGNVNIGFFIPSHYRYQGKEKELTAWLRHYLTRSRMQQLLGSDWRDEYFIERVEFPAIGAVHFVLYGILGRGVSSSSRLDGLGKGVADWIRDVAVDVPAALVE